MSYKITTNDYKKILSFYNHPIPSNKIKLKNMAENLLSLNLCKCIKKISPLFINKNQAKAIGVCTKTIFNKRGFKRGTFKCKNSRSVSFTKTRKNI
jgi:hypothetical protein